MKDDQERRHVCRLPEIGRAGDSRAQAELDCVAAGTALYLAPRQAIASTPSLTMSPSRHPSERR